MLVADHKVVAFACMCRPFPAKWAPVLLAMLAAGYWASPCAAFEAWSAKAVIER
jgi:hypothetical protein